MDPDDTQDKSQMGGGVTTQADEPQAVGGAMEEPTASTPTTPAEPAMPEPAAETPTAQAPSQTPTPLSPEPEAAEPPVSSIPAPDTPQEDEGGTGTGDQA